MKPTIKRVVMFVCFIVVSTLSYATEWHYEKEGENWGGLCKMGKRQSPIDITPPFYSSPTAIQIHYNNLIDKSRLSKQEVRLETAENTGNTIQVNGDAGSFKYGNHRFEVTQFHFHYPSEHTFNGRHYPLEMHIVHKDQLGNIAVVGILFEKSNKASHFLKALGWGDFPASGQTKHIEQAIGLSYFDDAGTNYLIYNGSFTTPPCTEGVQWFILNKRFPISQAQIDAWPHFKGAPEGNHRATQALNGRVVHSF